MERLLKKLNLLGDKRLFRFCDNNWKKNIPSRIHKGLEEINPDYFLVQKNKIVALFFDFSEKNIDERYVFKNIWNLGGVPIVFVLRNGLLDIYNGFSFEIENKKFTEIEKKINLNKDKIKLDFSLFNIFSGKIWENEKIKKKNLVDEELLKNLKNTRKILIEDEKLDKEITTNIIGRLLFSRYLVDRGVKVDNKFQKYFENKDEFVKLILDKEKLYNYFEYLKETFNGDLFPVLKGEKEIINDKHLNILFALFNGDKISEDKKIQKSLFNLYDFKIIPIELISEIYEQFMGEKQKKDSAFYTPSFLVDYILEKTVKKHLKENKTCKVFDPSCGSGIFLVESLRQIIEKNIDDLNELETEEKIEKLKNILKDNIFGVDLNKQAINVTIFSLCLTMLDYIEPKDISEGKVRFPTLLNKNLFVSDFFDLEDKFNLEIKNIDYILGNPPWGSFSDENKHKNHLDYIKKYGKNIVSDKQIAQTFILRLKDFVNQETEIALVLPSTSILYNYKSKNFRRFWLENFEINEILELSSVRKEIFVGAKAPAFIGFFKLSQNTENNIVFHKSLKPNLFLKILGLLVIEKNDIKEIQQKYFLKYDYLCKILLYGNILDFHFIKRLKDNYKTINDVIKENKLILGGGLKLKDGKKSIDTKTFIGKNFIEEKNLDKFFGKFSKFTFKKVGFLPKNKSIFKGPLVLFNKSTTSYFSSKSLFCGKDVLFKSRTYSIKGTENDILLLKNIVGLYNSYFSEYFGLHIDPQLGIHINEIYEETRGKFPIVEKKEIADLVDKIQEKYIELDNLKNSSLMINDEKLEIEIKKLENKLNNIILKSFNVSEEEKDLFDYTREIIIPWINNDKSVFSELKGENGKEYLRNYAKIFLDYFSKTWNGADGKYFEIDIYKDKYLVGMNFKVVQNDRNEKIKFIENENILNEFKKLVMLGEKNITDSFYEKRYVRGFNKNSFYVIKYNQKKNWHRGMGQTDLSEFIGAMMKSGIKKINNLH